MIGLSIVFLLILSGVALADSDNGGIAEASVELSGGLSGWLTVVAVSPFVIRRVHKRFLNTKNVLFKKLNKIVSKAHAAAGFLLLVVALLHGLLAEGTIFLFNTGPIAWLLLLLLSLVAVIGKKARIKMWLPAHRVLAALFVLIVLVHGTVA